jgi:hypothetical protein
LLWVVPALALFVVGGGLVTGWVILSGRTAGDVAVTWSPDSPACEGTTASQRGSQRPVIEAKETMRCVITVEVTNRGGRAVHVVQAVAPLVGPRTGAVVTAENAQRAARGDEYAIDALFSLDQDLRAGETTAFDVVLVFNPSGCNDSGTLWASKWPTVTVEVLGRSHQVHGDMDFAFHRNGATPGCERLEG